MATHSSILAWRSPWAEEPGVYRAAVHRVCWTCPKYQHACTPIYSKESQIGNNPYVYQLVNGLIALTFLIAQLVKNPPAMQVTWVGKIP